MRVLERWGDGKQRKGSVERVEGEEWTGLRVWSAVRRAYSCQNHEMDVLEIP